MKKNVGAQPEKAAKLKFTSYQVLVIAILIFLQFTIILDFMILSPMGALLMPVLQITPAQFGFVVSVYAFSAGISGFLAAGFADRYDRKKILMFFYGGFILGTLLCGIAPNYHFLLLARMITGIFGGVIGSIVFAIATDLFPIELRGRVMGFVQTAFSASQILGIPIGLYLSNRWGWHAPFLMIVGVSLAAGVVIIIYLKPIDAHLALQENHSAFRHLYKTVTKARYVQAFATTALLSTGGFMMMPFSSAFNVNNLGIHIEDLPLIYLVTGIASMIMGPIVGMASDKLGSFKMFFFGSLVSVIMIIYYTHLGVTPLWQVILISVLMFVGIFSRIISSSTLMSAVPTPANRGAFMSVGASVQQISGGIASIVAGFIVVQEPSGILDHFDTLGYVVAGAAVITTFMMFMIERSLKKDKQAAA